jgi:hypothetical protein
MAQQTFEELVAAVKQAESRGKRYADDGKTLTTSAKGALGEMQVMPKTILDPGFGVTPARDKSPDEIARVGVDYLQAMKQKYGDTEKALIAYNWGPGSTDKWLAAGADPKKLPAETRTYVERVKGFLGGKDVPRETSVAKKEREPLPASLPPMAQAPTIKPEAAARVASLGPGYQAALALSFLAETDDEEDRKTTITQEYLAKAQEEEDDRAASAAIAKRQSNVFADLSNTTIRSPFAELQQPVMMKDGGDVTERKDKPFFDAASRTFVDVMSGRREPITGKDFTAKEQMAMMDAVRRSQARGGKGRVDYQDYPSGEEIGPGYVDIRNTLGGFQYKQTPDGATVITDRYDFHGPRVAEYEKMGTGEKLVKSAKNALTEFVKGGFSPRDLAGELGRAYVGSKGPDVNIRIPVNRAEGSPEEGEVAPRLTMQQIERLAAQEAAEREAASTPAFIAQKSGIGRKAGPVSQALQSGQGQIEFLKGMTNVPQNILGAPMDISNMIAGIYGGNVEKPFMGSEYLKEKSRAAGLGFTPSTDPTLAAFYGAGDLGSNLVNPAGATRTGVKAAGAVAEKAGEAARDFQQYNQQLAVPGASYIRRPAGGVFPTAKNVEDETISALDKSLKDIVSSNLKMIRAPAENKEAAKEFIDTKLRDYFKTKAGSVSDPLREALIGGRIKIPKDTPLEEQFPQALINASRAGDVTAMKEIEKRFDNMMGISSYRVQPAGAGGNDQREAAESFKQIILQQMKTNPSIIPDEFLLRLSKKDADALPPQKAEETIKEIRQKLADNPTLFNTIYEPKISRLLDRDILETVTEENVSKYPNLYPSLANAPKRQEGIMALQADVPITDLNYLGFPDIFNISRSDLVEELTKISPKDLAQMSVPEFYAKAIPSIAKKEVFRETIRTVDKLISAKKPVPTELGYFGTKEFLPTDSSGMTWREIIDPQAALIQAKFLGNSIGGYAEAGTYGPLDKGINALKDGETRLFSLYDKNGYAVNNVEFITPKIVDDKLHGYKANTITQMNGNGVRTGNVVPEQYAEQMLDLVNALNPKDIPATIKQLFQDRGLIANPLPTQRATGGMIERQPNDNRRYM